MLSRHRITGSSTFGLPVGDVSYTPHSSGERDGSGVLVGVFDRVTKVCVEVRDGVLVAPDERDELGVPVTETVDVVVDDSVAESVAESTGWIMKVSTARATGVRQGAEATRRFTDQRRDSESSEVAGDICRAIRYPAVTKRKET